MMTRDALPMLLPDNAVGVELGVARGCYSDALLQSGKFSLLYSVDMWAGDRGHTTDEMDFVTDRLYKFGPISRIVQATFEDFASEIEAGSLDFLYLDGYAHNAATILPTLETWRRKIKPGGIIAGHDYCNCWGPVPQYVDAFASIHNLSIRTTDERCEMTLRHPSWYAVV